MHNFLKFLAVVLFLVHCHVVGCETDFTKNAGDVVTTRNHRSGHDSHREGVKVMPRSRTPAHHWGVFGSMKCSICRISINYFLWKFRTEDGKYPGLPRYLTTKCVEWGIDSPTVCKGIIKAMTNETLYVLNRLKLNGQEICSLAFPTKCHAPTLSWNRQWLVDLPAKPSKIRRRRKQRKGNTLRALQISDIHVDMQYEEGSEADCAEPLCCRASVTNYTSIHRPAGPFGSYGKCDIPYRLLDHMLAHLSNQSFDYIMWTGDLPAHDDWEQSKAVQLDLLQNLTDTLLRYFPSTPIYPSLGNHESFPVNSFPPRYITEPQDNISWLYNKLTQVWAPWLPAAALETVRQFGYYTLLHRPGFRIVSINMNYCNDMNWWTLVDPVDPDHQLRWLVKVLAKAEADGEKVHILGHIPPAVVSSNCLPVWRNNLYRVVDRFRDVITGQFYGHTHNDQFEVMYSDDDREDPMSVAYVAPSVTTFGDLNPGYRVYDVRAGTWEVENHENFIMNLSKVGEDREAEWEFLYDAKTAYDLVDLGRDSWHGLLASWSTEATGRIASFARYYYNYYKGHPPKPDCDLTCRRKMTCEIAVGNFTLNCNR